MKFERARNQEQKNIRVNQITEAAATLFESVPYERISMATIARELDFTRGNLYKYFSTKEEIFLKVIEHDQRKWIADLEEAFSADEPLELTVFARRWAEVLLKNKRLIELFSILYSVIEKNVTVEKLAEFKTEFFTLVPAILSIMKKQFPGLPDDKLELFAYMQFIFAMSLYPVTLESDVQRKAIALSGIPYEKPDFVEMFTQFMVITASGIDA